MINSGRSRERGAPESHHSRHGREARLTAIIGSLIFTVFLCLSVNTDTSIRSVDHTSAEGVCQVFLPVGGTSVEENASAVSDNSVWAYLESIISRLIYGES